VGEKNNQGSKKYESNVGDDHQSRWYGPRALGLSRDPQDPCAYYERKLVNGCYLGCLGQDEPSESHGTSRDGAGKLERRGGTSSRSRGSGSGSGLSGGVYHEGGAGRLDQRSGRAGSDAEGRARVGSAGTHRGQVDEDETVGVGSGSESSL
jgi:hypothetical protein